MQMMHRSLTFVLLIGSLLLLGALPIVAQASSVAAPNAAGCVELISNGSFEVTGGWGIPTTSWSAAYSTARAYDGTRSMRAGIDGTTNRFSYSDFYQVIAVPADRTQLTFWMWPKSVSTTAAAKEAPEPLAPKPAAPFPGGIEAYMDSLRAQGMAAGDVQYLLILNQQGAWIGTLMWELSNAQTWQARSFDLSAYAGRTIRLQWGVYNDGTGARTAMYIDLVSALNCPGACTEMLTNGGFESLAGWNIPATAWSAGYSTVQKHNGSRSMRAGIYGTTNLYSYSDFYQVITVPGGGVATVGFWMWPRSTGTVAVTTKEGVTEVAPAEVMDQEVAEADVAPVPAAPAESVEAYIQQLQVGGATPGDVQYLLILNQSGIWIDTLMWERNNAQIWQYRAFSLDAYRGTTIRLQWGVFNNGTGGTTVMFVDDASALSCPSN